MFIHTYHEYWNQGWIVAAFARINDVNKFLEMRQWCYDTYGKPGDRWKDGIAYGEVLFNAEKDLTLFLLKWA